MGFKCPVKVYAGTCFRSHYPVCVDRGLDLVISCRAIVQVASLPISALRAIVVGVLAMIGQAALATSLNVPQELQSIQQAINAASPGDEIIVAPGVYHEHLDFLGKAITVRSEAGPAVTILDGDFDGRVVEMSTDEGRNSVLTGFTLRHGSSQHGGAIYLLGASPTIVGNIFEDSWGDGAGMVAWGGAPLVTRNIFRNHSLCSAVVDIIGLSDIEFIGNVIADNDCEGISMYVYRDNAPLIANNTIARNEVGIRFVSAYSAEFQVLRNNLLYGNDEGLVWFPLTADPVRPQWRHNLVYGNGVDYKDVDDPTGIDGNISVDPLLNGLDVSDYNPDDGSPAVDAGENAPADTETDLQGRPRRHDGDGDGVATIDIGASELRAPTPRVVLTLDPAQVPLGESTTLTWSSTGADTCEARGEPWSGSRPTSGTEQWSSDVPHRPVFQLACTGDGVARGKSVELIVGEVFPVEMSITPEAIADDQSATLTWSAPDATTCQASGAWSGEVAPSGSRVVSHPYVHGAHTYALSCSSATGTGRASATVQAQPSPGVSIDISPLGITAGETTTITWVSTNAVRCWASGWWYGDIPTSGSMVVKPPKAGLYDYIITCWGSTGSSITRQTGLQVFPSDESSGGGGGRVPWEFTLMLMPALGRRGRRD